MTHLQFNGRPVAKYNGFFNDLFEFPSVLDRSARVPALPAANVYETPEAYHLELNAPGRQKEDFKISMDKDLLTISAEQTATKKEEGDAFIRREFSFNSFKRSFTLDEKIDAGNIRAKYDNGILKIELPKKEEVKQEARQITVS